MVIEYSLYCDKKNVTDKCKDVLDKMRLNEKMYYMRYFGWFVKPITTINFYIMEFL